MSREWKYQYGYFVNEELVVPLGLPVSTTLAHAELMCRMLIALGVPGEIDGAYFGFDYACKYVPGEPT
jgi:hypothetical protein